jgi:hypothetical protein
MRSPNVDSSVDLNLQICGGSYSGRRGFGIPGTAMMPNKPLLEHILMHRYGLHFQIAPLTQSVGQEIDLEHSAWQGGSKDWIGQLPMMVSLCFPTS